MKAALGLRTGWTQVFQELTGSSADCGEVMRSAYATMAPRLHSWCDALEATTIWQTPFGGRLAWLPSS